MQGARLSQGHGPLQAAWGLDADLHTFAREKALEPTSELTVALTFGASQGSVCLLHQRGLDAGIAHMLARIAAASGPYVPTDPPVSTRLAEGTY